MANNAFRDHSPHHASSTENGGNTGSTPGSLRPPHRAHHPSSTTHPKLTLTFFPAGTTSPAIPPSNTPCLCLTRAAHAAPIPNPTAALTHMLQHHALGLQRLATLFPSLITSRYHMDSLTAAMQLLWPPMLAIRLAEVPRDSDAMVAATSSESELPTYCAYDLYLSNTTKLRGYGASEDQAQRAALLHAVVYLAEADGRTLSAKFVTQLNFAGLLKGRSYASNIEMPVKAEAHYAVPIPAPPATHDSRFTSADLGELYAHERQLLRGLSVYRVRGAINHEPAWLLYLMHVPLPPTFQAIYVDSPTEPFVRVTMATAHVTVVGDGPSAIKAWHAALQHLVYLSVRGEQPSSWEQVYKNARRADYEGDARESASRSAPTSSADRKVAVESPRKDSSRDLDRGRCRSRSRNRSRSPDWSRRDRKSHRDRDTYRTSPSPPPSRRSGGGYREASTSDRYHDRRARESSRESSSTMSKRNDQPSASSSRQRKSSLDRDGDRARRSVRESRRESTSIRKPDAGTNPERDSIQSFSPPTFASGARGSSLSSMQPAASTSSVNPANDAIDNDPEAVRTHLLQRIQELEAQLVQRQMHTSAATGPFGPPPAPLYGPQTGPFAPPMGLPVPHRVMGSFGPNPGATEHATTPAGPFQAVAHYPPQGFDTASTRIESMGPVAPTPPPLASFGPPQHPPPPIPGAPPITAPVHVPSIGMDVLARSSSNGGTPQPPGPFPPGLYPSLYPYPGGVAHAPPPPPPTATFRDRTLMLDRMLNVHAAHLPPTSPLSLLDAADAQGMAAHPMLLTWVDDPVVAMQLAVWQRTGIWVDADARLRCTQVGVGKSGVGVWVASVDVGRAGGGEGEREIMGTGTSEEEAVRVVCAKVVLAMAWGE